MANALYDSFMQFLGEAAIDLVNDELRIALIDTAVETFDSSDVFINHLAAGSILAEATLTQTWGGAVLDAADFAGTFPDHGGGATGEALVIYQHVPTTNAIVAVNQGTRTFSIAGNLTVTYRAGKKIVVAGSTGNNGTYNIESATYDGSTNTDVVVREAIPSAVADGNIETSATTSKLCMWLDTGITGIPATADGVDDSITFHASGIWSPLTTACP